MTTFFDSQHCKTHFHCPTCRDKAGGVDWRKSIMNGFDDVKSVNFRCPDKVKWGEKPCPREHVAKAPRPVEVIPEPYASMDMDAMIVTIGKLPEDKKHKGLLMAEKQKAMIDSADCSPCREKSSLRTMRRWLMNQEAK